jgi:hypothetical protein
MSLDPFPKDAFINEVVGAYAEVEKFVNILLHRELTNAEWEELNIYRARILGWIAYYNEHVNTN